MHFVMLSHLHHDRLLNMPFYILHALQNMAHYVKTSSHPLSSITNHGLIKLQVKRSLARHNLTWEQFVVGSGVHWAPAVGHIGEREVEWSSSGSARGRGEELEEGGDDQEEYSREDETTKNPIEKIIGATVVIE